MTKTLTKIWDSVFIPLIPSYSPVRKVNYTRWKLHVWARLQIMTNWILRSGPTAPLAPAGRSWGCAAKLLKDHMTIFINFEEELETELRGEDRPQIKNENLNRSVEELELSVWSYNFAEKRKHSEHRRAGPED